MQLQHFQSKQTKLQLVENMTEEFEIPGISTGAWWSSPTNTTTVYSLPRSTEISLDVTNFGWQNFDNKIDDPNDGFINM